MNSLTEDQKKMIVLEYGATKSFAEVRKAFAKQYYPNHPRKVPPLMTFKRVIDRFCQTAELMLFLQEATTAWGTKDK